MRSTHLRSALGGLVALLISGCSGGSSSDCPAARTPVTVEVFDADNGLEVCNAEVVGTDGSSTFEATKVLGPDAALSDEKCLYVFNPGVSGTYTMSATAPGLTSLVSTETVTMQYGACGYEGGGITVYLLLTR